MLQQRRPRLRKSDSPQVPKVRLNSNEHVNYIFLCKSHLFQEVSLTCSLTVESECEEVFGLSDVLTVSVLLCTDLVE